MATAQCIMQGRTNSPLSASQILTDFENFSNNVPTLMQIFYNKKNNIDASTSYVNFYTDTDSDQYQF